MEFKEELLKPWLEAIKAKGFYQLSSCSICGCETGWGFFDDMPEGLVWDGGCDCVRYDGRRYADEKDLYFYLVPDHGHLPKIEAFIAQPPPERDAE